MKYTGWKGMSEAGNIRLYNADNMELMRQCPDDYYELAIVLSCYLHLKVLYCK